MLEANTHESDGVWDCGEQFLMPLNHMYAPGPVCDPTEAVNFLAAIPEDSMTNKVPDGAGYPIGPSIGLNYLILTLHIQNLTSTHEEGSIGLIAKAFLPDSVREHIPQRKRPKSLMLFATGFLEPKSVSAITNSYEVPVPLNVFTMFLHGHPSLIRERVWLKRSGRVDQRKGDLLVESRNLTNGMTDDNDRYTNINLRLNEGDVLTVQCVFNSTNPQRVQME
jgi:hypothetical protein